VQFASAFATEEALGTALPNTLDALCAGFGLAWASLWASQPRTRSQGERRSWRPSPCVYLDARV